MSSLMTGMAQIFARRRPLSERCVTRQVVAMHP
jgi:hypothetical protein